MYLLLTNREALGVYFKGFLALKTNKYMKF